MSTDKTWTATSTTHLYRHKSGTYYARLNVAGKPTWRSLKTKILSVAKPELAKTLDENAFRDELSHDTPVTEKMTGAEALALRESQLLNNPATKSSTKKYWTQVVGALKKSWPDLLTLEMRRISVEQCEAWAGKASKQMSAVRFNSCLLVVKSLFKIAIKHGVRRTNPGLSIKRAKVRRKDLSNKLPSQSRFRDWVVALRERRGSKAQPKADMVELLAYTGMRIGESKWVQWRHCDFGKGEILVLGTPDNGTKNGSFRRIPMIPAARKLLERLKADQEPAATDYVLRVKDADKAMKSAAKTIGIDALTHHDLRHLFATMCIESGVDIPTVSRWLGHRDGGILAMQVYGHLRNEHSLTAASRVSFSA